METHKKAVLWTGFCAFLFLGCAITYKALQPPTPFVFDVEGHPSIGQGPTQIVIFEDFRCSNCRKFTEEIFPVLVDLYVNTGKAEMIFVPIAFDGFSKPLANAALSVYRIAPNSFVPFVLALSKVQPSSQQEILDLARFVGGIDLRSLTEKMNTKLYYAEIERNLFWARSIMGEEFGTPTLLIQGIEVPIGSLDKIALYIERNL
jgi:protein-disulfide isomerase